MSSWELSLTTSNCLPLDHVDNWVSISCSDRRHRWIFLEPRCGARVDYKFKDFLGSLFHLSILPDFRCNLLQIFNHFVFNLEVHNIWYCNIERGWYMNVINKYIVLNYRGICFLFRASHYKQPCDAERKGAVWRQGAKAHCFASRRVC